TIEPELSWENGRYRAIDGLFCEVISEKQGVIKARKIAREDYFFIVSDGTNYAHGRTIKEAQEELIYKISARDTSAFAEWGLQTMLSLQEAILSYRRITGACKIGVEHFLQSLETIPEHLTVNEVIILSKGQYGNETYSEFFATIGKKAHE
ncbi:MAG: hypothetical protein LBV04_06675, partial [Deferribacteraceae bacterium]|nr:hypothetical protein [Deferribacteraceae bacterium]